MCVSFWLKTGKAGSSRFHVGRKSCCCPNPCKGCSLYVKYKNAMDVDPKAILAKSLSFNLLQVFFNFVTLKV